MAIIMRAPKTFALEDEITCRSVIISFQIPTGSTSVDLTALLDAHCPLLHHRVSVYDPLLATFTPIHSPILPQSYFLPDIILIRYSKLPNNEHESEDDSSERMEDQDGEEIREKKERSKERTILQVIEVVRKWRALHDHPQKYDQPRKLNLQQAAKAVGISKKSLDDYYYQLRLGELHHFDFSSKLNQKIGVLRSFVKRFKTDKDRHKNSKHPKQLRIIEDTIEPTEQRSLQPHTPAPPKEQQSEWKTFENPFTKALIDSYENQFYNNFKFLLDSPDDPFISFDREYKSDSHEFSEDYFL